MFCWNWSFLGASSTDEEELSFHTLQVPHRIRNAQPPAAMPAAPLDTAFANTVAPAARSAVPLDATFANRQWDSHQLQVSCGEEERTGLPSSAGGTEDRRIASLQVLMEQQQEMMRQQAGKEACQTLFLF
ncbi:uncharacterized protein LOC144160924 [Haemaphysalis longicornis]